MILLLIVLAGVFAANEVYEGLHRDFGRNHRLIAFEYMDSLSDEDDDEEIEDYEMK